MRSSISLDDERPRRKANEAWRDGKLLARFPPPHTSTTTADKRLRTNVQ